MPRFGTKSLLIVFVVVALWMSTFTGYRAGGDVRASILLLIFVGSAAAALCNHGQRRAFWGSFFGVMLLCGGNSLQSPLYRYVPQFAWLSASPYVAPTDSMPGTGGVIDIADNLPLPFNFAAGASNRRDAIVATIAATWTLTLATLAGFFGAYIYNHSAAD